MEQGWFDWLNWTKNQVLYTRNESPIYWVILSSGQWVTMAEVLVVWSLSCEMTKGDKWCSSWAPRSLPVSPTLIKLRFLFWQTLACHLHRNYAPARWNLHKLFKPSPSPSTTDHNWSEICSARVWKYSLMVWARPPGSPGSPGQDFLSAVCRAGLCWLWILANI